MVFETLSRETLVSLWGSGMNSDAERADNFLEYWARNGIVTSSRTWEEYAGISFDVEGLTAERTEDLYLKIFDTINRGPKKAGAHRHHDWELGWKSSLLSYQSSKTLNDLVPGYFENSRINRLGDSFYSVSDRLAEVTFLGFLVDLLAEFAVLEFGRATS